MFTRSGSTWTQQGQKLTGTGESRRRPTSADSVALSADGNTALIGGPGDNTGVGRGVGVHALGLDLDPAGPKLTASGETGAGDFGDSVALSSEGNTALIGGAGDNGGIGAAWVFTRSGSTWTQQGAKLTGRRRERQRRVRLQRGALRRRQHRADRRPRGQRRVGAAWVFTRVGLDLDPAGRKAHRQRRERRTAWLRRQRRASSEAPTPR